MLYLLYYDEWGGDKDVKKGKDIGSNENVDVGENVGYSQHSLLVGRIW